jgi:hypothetical protein
VAAATMEQIDKAHQWRVPVSAAAHGHVAVVTRGNGSRGWPRGYWGTHGADGGRNESLSVSFVGKHPEQVDFYVYRVLPPYAPTTLSV